MGKRGTKPRDIALRFWEKVDRTGDCWVWTSATKRGYGHFSLNGNTTAAAHRLSWEWANGQPVPEGLWVLHHCDNPPCVRPEHLFVGPPAMNTADMIAKGRQKRGTSNPARGEAAPRALLTEADVIAMREQRRQGFTYKAIGMTYGVHLMTARSAIVGINWKHLQEGL